MSKFKPLNTTPIDTTHTLDQLTGRFQTVQDGLPELLKNAKDQYARHKVNERGHRQIVIVVSAITKALGVLDFAGATAKEFDGWAEWSSRTSSRADRSGDIEGGHGNGGKAFMVRGSATDAYIESCFLGRRTKMGFNNNEPTLKYRPGYWEENGQPIRDQVISDMRTCLDRVLAQFGVNYEDLPVEARENFESRNAFTIVHLTGVKDWLGRRSDAVRNMINDIPEMLENHPQAALSLETSSVWVMHGKNLLTQSRLSPQYPDPIAELANLQPIPVPDVLEDPKSKSMVNTGSGDATTKYLQLWTSREHLRASAKKRALNVIRVRNERNVVANWSMPELCSLPSNAFIYGEIRLPDMQGEHLSGADRHSVADTALVRAVTKWVEDRVTELAKRIQQVRSNYDNKDQRDAASKTLRRIRDLMRDFLRPAGSLNVGLGDQPGRTTGKEKTRLGNVVHLIELEASRPVFAMANGTTVPLRVRCYEIDPNGERLVVPGVQLKIVSADPIVRQGARNMLEAIAPGVTTLYVETQDGHTKSEPITVEVCDCIDAEISHPNRVLKQGEQISLKVGFLLVDGTVRDDLLVEGTVDTLDMGQFNRDGVFSTSYHEGDATLAVRFGPDVSHLTSTQVSIGADRVEPAGKTGGPKADIPLILMCGEEAPGLEDLPPDQRTHHGGVDYPTIVDFEPQYGPVIWINQFSKESGKIRASRRGPGEQAGLDTKTFQQFLAIKCFEVLADLRSEQEAGEGVSLPRIAWRNLRAQAEMDCAAFLDAAFLLVEDLTSKMGESEDRNGKAISA